MNIALLSARSFMEEHNCYNEPLDKLYKARYLKSNLYNLLQIAQRLQYPQYCKMYNFCMSSTCYLEYGDFAVFYRENIESCILSPNLRFSFL